MRYQISLQNAPELMKKLQATEDQMGKAVKATVSDFRSRGYGWVWPGIKEHYNIKRKDVKETEKTPVNSGAFRVGSVTVNDVALRYVGRRLTPIHFGMTPKKPKMRTRKGTPYQVRPQPQITAEIVRGRKKTFQTSFLASSNNSPFIPFKRTGRSAYPIEPVKTVSVPQMVSSKDTEADIYKKINENLDKRLENHIKRFAK